AGLVETRTAAPSKGSNLLGVPLEAKPLRLGAERELRACARFATTRGADIEISHGAAAGGTGEQAALPRCPRCGAPAAPGDSFCEIDGTRLVPESAAVRSSGGASRPSCASGAAADDGDGYC
ncbi:MAG: hypothetical protein ACR2PL_13135, partial [Dehalococcoidia bacterium]